MEITFTVLLWAVRIAFLVLLYVFLIRAFSGLWRAMRTGRPWRPDPLASRSWSCSARIAAAPAPETVSRCVP